MYLEAIPFVFVHSKFPSNHSVWSNHNGFSITGVYLVCEFMFLSVSYTCPLRVFLVPFIGFFSTVVVRIILFTFTLFYVQRK